MKKIILSVMMCAMGAFAFAQQGVFEVGGNIGFSTSSSKINDGESADVTSVSVMPSFMYYVTDKLAIGAELGFSYEKGRGNMLNNFDSDLFGEDPSISLFRIQPTLRYSIPIAGKFSYAPQFFVNIGFGSVNLDQEGLDDPSIFNLGVGFNIVRFQYDFTSKMGISFACGDLRYDYAKTSMDVTVRDQTTEIKSTSNNFNLGLNLAPTLGFYYKF